MWIVVEVVGLALIVAGVAFWSPQAALIVAGLLLVAVAEMWGGGDE